MIQGMIFDIDRYAIHDGHGIRCLIFMKGCPIHCEWCSNPEGQNFSPEVAFFPAKCINCGTCVEVCPQGAIHMDESGPVTDWERCDDCGQCVEECCAGARRLFGTRLGVDDLFKEIKKDIVFFRNSGGGVTIGGGEVTAQPEFVREFLKRCKKEDINTAIETCGYCPWESLKGICEYTDLVFYDIKHMDHERHKKSTGFSNQKILKNLIRLSREPVDLIIRVPVITRFNDDAANIRATATFVTESLDTSRLRRVELLPYHRYGAFKYDRLGRKYRLSEVEPPQEEEMKALKEIVESCGLICRIGG